MGRKRAVLVGINYPGTEGELKGCFNDVTRMRRCLIDRFGFDGADIRVLTDVDPSTPPPTGANIREELERLVGEARFGDTLFFHYSGHGLQLPAETGLDDDTGYDECIVPCDTNLIKDQDFTELVRKVPDGCLFTMVSDSCHSGGLIDKTKEQIGNSTKQSKIQQLERPPSAAAAGAKLLVAIRRALEYMRIRLPRRGQQQSSEEPRAKTESPAATGVTNRSLALSAYIQMLKEKTGNDDVGVGSIRTTLFHHFGDDATPMVKKFVKVMSSCGELTQHGTAMTALANANPDGNGGGEGEGEVEQVYAGPPATRKLPRNGVLVSGCQTDETSADVTTAKGVSYGALSDAIQVILSSRRKVTNRELVVRAQKLLTKKGYVQRPGLYCSDEHANAPFIC